MIIYILKLYKNRNIYIDLYEIYMKLYKIFMIFMIICDEIYRLNSRNLLILNINDFEVLVF